MRLRIPIPTASKIVISVILLLCGIVAVGGVCRGSESFDVISGILESPQFKRLPYLEKLNLAAELLKSNKLKQSDLSFVLLDWADRYLREPSDPLERLHRWARLTSDEKLKNIRLPRDFLNRMLVAEYLVSRTPYAEAGPRKKLEILSGLEKRQLLDWAVFLAYARVYAGGIVMGAEKYADMSPLQALKNLKRLKHDGLIGWHYKVPTESVLAAEALAADAAYREASPQKRLEILRNLERNELISPLTRKELEKLPAWRMLLRDPSFRKADPAAKKKRLVDLGGKGLISESTVADLIEVFTPPAPTSPIEPKPAPLPREIRPEAR